MLYAIVAIIIFVASFLFAMLGLGGGMVYVPVLTLAGFDVKEVAIPLGLLLNGLNTLLALIPFARKKIGRLERRSCNGFGCIITFSHWSIYSKICFKRYFDDNFCSGCSSCRHSYDFYSQTSRPRNNNVS